MTAAGTTADRLGLAVFGLVLCGFAAQGLVADGGGIRTVQDHTITVSLGRELLDEGAYHPDYFYPLPAVAWKLALGALPHPLSSLLFAALCVGAGLAAAEAIARLKAPAASSARHAGALLGALAIVYCLQWDLRAVNTNTLFLALVLWACERFARGRDGAGALLLAASVALKLTSAPLLALLWLLGRRRAALLGLAWLVVFFVLLPLLWLGPETAVSLTRAWLAQVVAAADPAAEARITAYNVSWLRAVRGLLGDGGEGVASPAAAALARAIALAFAASVALRWWRGRMRAPGEAAGVHWLADAGLALTAALLASPITQPHHGVVLWPLAATTAALALDPQAERSRRVLAAALLAGVGVALVAAPAGTGKALALAAGSALLALGALASLREHDARATRRSAGEPGTLPPR